MALKIINDPIYGFIGINGESIYRLIEHPYFQRLRRIQQLGMTYLVYPGATHSRFQHALGAMHLMQQAVEVLRSKGHAISKEEQEGVMTAILLHDIGHGPYSHALENTIVKETKHEILSELMMDRLNEHFNGSLTLAIQIFNNHYHRRFLHQLVSGQLDMDRMDYLTRDSFFTGVAEGVISHDRIIKMLEIHQDELAVESKGIYSIEKFIVARRLMYWQVYLHKTVVSGECLMIAILKRAKELARKGVDLFATPTFRTFLSNDFTEADFRNDSSLVDRFSMLDDSDITASIKVWSSHEDPVLSDLCGRMINRKLFKIRIQDKPFEEKTLASIKEKFQNRYKISDEVIGYYFINGQLVNNAYTNASDKINILYKDGTVKDIAEAADTLNIKALSESVNKYYICSPSF